MNKIRKAGLLIVTLVIPALIFTFLKFFATNHYDLPYYHALRDDKGNVLIKDSDTTFYRPQIKGLKSLDGSVLSNELFSGKVTVLSIIPAVVDQVMRKEYAELERVYGLRTSIPYLELITATGLWPFEGGDLPKVMGTKGWQIALFSDTYGVSDYYNDLKLDTEVPGAKANRTENKLVLIDQSGYVRGYYDGADSEEIDRLMAEIKILDYEKKN
jgi:protein SCO1/2